MGNGHAGPRAAAGDRRHDARRDRSRSHTQWKPQRTTGRWRFLADASATLDASLDYEETLANTARLAVPEVADYCVVVLLGEDGSVRWAHSAHRDPRKQVLLDRLRECVPPIASAEHPISTTLRTGRAQLVTDVRRNLVDWWDTGRLELVHALVPLASIAAPLSARGRTFGAVLFVVSEESGRRYGTRDLELAIDVGRRAGFAIDHALLYREAERAARARDELMAVVAHDLKNPLNNIQLAANVLLEEEEDGEGGRREIDRHAVGAIARAATRMQKLIHDLLEVARAEGGKMLVKPRPSDPVELLRDAVDAHSSMASAKNIVFEARSEERLPSVLADHDRIAQVFANLIGNALKFTPAGGRVSVRGWSAAPFVRFAVEDTGPGIAAPDQARVFDRFWQANGSEVGTGLGLSIAKSIVLAHHGEIRVESAVGHGSRFEFSLPAVDAVAAEQAPGPARAHVH